MQCGPTLLRSYFEQTNCKKTFMKTWRKLGHWLDIWWKGIVNFFRCGNVLQFLNKSPYLLEIQCIYELNYDDIRIFNLK